LKTQLQDIYAYETAPFDVDASFDKAMLINTHHFSSDALYSYIDEFETEQIAENMNRNLPYKVDVVINERIHRFESGLFVGLEPTDRLRYDFHRFGTESSYLPDEDLFPISMDRSINYFEPDSETQVINKSIFSHNSYGST